MLADAGVRKAAEPFVRVLVRVPEAYLLLKPYDCTRPGLLVIDADGRRVDALSLAPALKDELKPAEIAAWLATAAKGHPRQRIRFSIDSGDATGVEKLLEGLRKGWKAELIRDGDVVTFDTPRTRLDIDRWSATRVLHLAGRTRVGITIEDPVRVALTAADPKLDLAEFEALACVPGARKFDRASPAVFIARLLLDPNTLRRALPRFTPDIESRVYEFEMIPKGAKGAPVCAAPLKVAGVLTVFPDIDNDEVTVVMRPGTDDAAIRAAFERAGVRPDPPDQDTADDR